MKRARTAALRAGVTPGLAIVEPASRNTLIAYAAKSGTAAEDGIGRHSPFTTALLNNLFVPGLDVRLAFGRVRDEVLKNTRNRQEPFVSGSLGGAHLSLVPPPPQPVVAAAATSDERARRTTTPWSRGSAPNGPGRCFSTSTRKGSMPTSPASTSPS